MFKKSLKVALSLIVLVTAHFAYVRLFAIVAQHAGRGRGNAVQLQPTDSRTKKEAIALAARAFGEKHWSADHDLPGRYYNKERGYWMYYKEYERRNEGKQFLFKPFALIWQSRDKKELKTVTADEAMMDLDQPLGLAPNKPGSPPMRMTHAQIIGNVRIRDDRGTADAGDDMLIGPMPYIEYDEATLQLRSESDVVIQDREMRVTGYDLLIQLRPKEEVDPAATGGGFDGAKTAFLKQNPHVILYDSGNSGVLPGKSAAPQQAGSGERTPIDLRCAGQMQIDLPKPRLPVRIGPPAPPDPTFATFTRDVVVLQAKPKQVPDQLNCDYLKLTLLPGKKAPPTAATATPTGAATAPAPPEVPANASAEASAAPATTGARAAPAEPAADGGALGGLTLRRADATGHAVWLQSVSQGIKTLSNELIYKKLAPENPDETYLRGDTPKGILVEKIDLVKEGPDKGKIEQITTVRSSDATIFDDGQNRDPETIIARGPGILEIRPARDKPVTRRALWRDQLVMQNEIAADKQLRKRITLTGDPKFFDLAQATSLDAKNEIIVWLKPKPEPVTPDLATTATATVASSSQVPAKAQPGGGKFDIEVLRALNDVHLLAPGRTLTARDVLVALFETMPTPTPATASDSAMTAGAPANSTTAKAPANAMTGPPPAAAGQAPVPVAQGEVNVEKKPTDPDVRVRANHVWARIAVRPKGQPGTAPGGAGARAPDGKAGENTKSELREARLRGSVDFHEDPAPGKQRGTNVTGEAIDVTNLGENKMYFKVYNVDPDKAASLDQRAKLSPTELLARIETLGRSYPLARVETEDLTVDGPKIGLNQMTDEAWVDGRGTLTQLAPRGLLSDKGLENTPDQDMQSPGQTTQRTGQTIQSPAQTTQRTGQTTQPPAQTTQRAAQTTQPPPAQTSAPTPMTPLRISWTRSMQFKGQSTNLQGVPVARAHFVANVHAEMEDSVMRCQEMTTYMDRTVKLVRPKDPKTPGPGNGAQPPQPEPKPQIALIDCLYKVWVDNRKHDPETRTLLQRQLIEGEHVIYEKLTGNFFATPGPGQLGRVYLYSREGEDPIGNPSPAPVPDPSPTADRRMIRPTASPAAQPVPVRRGTEVVTRSASSPATAGVDAAAGNPKDKANAKGAAPAKPAFGPLKVTQVVYADEMHGRFGTGKDRDTTETRWADFFGDVEVLHAPALSEFDIFDFDNPPSDATFLTAQTIRVVSEPPPPGSKTGARSFLTAWDNANAETIDTTIQADKITYDSSKELFYAYGELDQVYLVQQKFVGQPPVTASGRAVKYNRKTGESQVLDPKSVQFVDDKFGVRPGRAVVPEPKKKGKKPLVPFRGPGRAHFERKGFNGH